MFQISELSFFRCLSFVSVPSCKTRSPNWNLMHQHHSWFQNLALLTGLYRRHSFIEIEGCCSTFIINFGIAIASTCWCWRVLSKMGSLMWRKSLESPLEAQAGGEVLRAENSTSSTQQRLIRKPVIRLPIVFEQSLPSLCSSPCP